MRLWRIRPDSSQLAQPRAMVRLFVGPDELDAAVAFHERLLGHGCDLRFDYPEAGLALASVADVLIIAGEEPAVAPFRATAYTLLVASLDRCLARLPELGAELVEAPKAVPTGRNMLVRHPDGSLVEYVEHRPAPGE